MDDCMFCGERAKMWCGDDSSCDSCAWLYNFQTHEPSFSFHMAPTPTQQLVGIVLSIWFNFICRFIPARYVIDGNRMAIWAYSGAYWHAERAIGRI